MGNFFLSSNPSIEQNFIEKNLWEYDYIYHSEFFNQNELKLWSELPSLGYPEFLKQYKLENQKLIEGVYIPIDYGVYRAIFSFGFKKMHSLNRSRSSNYAELLTIGKYYLNKINNVLYFPDRKKINTKPQLTLITNKEGSL